MIKLLKLSKSIKLVILGNILEHYDFLLFLHLGTIITPLFFPKNSPTNFHILSLALLGLSYIVRPIGGLLFGKLADVKGRKYALIKTVKWSVFPSIALVILPTYEIIGLWSSILFIVIRLAQGIALGGEYPIAGTFIIEQSNKNYGFNSSILVASGTIGSMIGFIISFLCIYFKDNQLLWRVGFLLGGLGTIINLYMRKYLVDIDIHRNNLSDLKIENSKYVKLGIFLIGLLVGSTVLLPMTYSSFYITKILKFDILTGMFATLTALVSYIIIVPLCGILFDKFKDDLKYMYLSCLTIILFSYVGINLLASSFIWQSQILLVISASLFGAPIHVMMNKYLPMNVRGRNIGFYFMIGLSVSGMFPTIFTYYVTYTGFYLIPAIVISIIALITFFYFYNLKIINK